MFWVLWNMVASGEQFGQAYFYLYLANGITGFGLKCPETIIQTPLHSLFLQKQELRLF